MTLRLLSAVLLAAVSLYAQQTSITGTLTDQSGGAIPDAKVTVTQAGASGLAMLSNKQGVFQFPSLNAGEYVVRVEAPGFAPAEKTITLLVGQSVVTDLQLRPANVSSTVEVKEEAESVATTSSAVSGNIDPHQMHDVPVNGRNWMTLALMVPGITKNDVDSSSPIGGADGGKFQINVDGQQVTQNNSGSGNGQPRYSQDAIAEFQIITNRFDATQGRSLRVQLNAQTKTGSNEFHGSAFGYFRNDKFNAADFVSKTVLPYSDQQYGGTIGGPILHDKLWFFGSFEGERQPATIFTTPTGFGGISYTLPTQNTTREYLARFDYQANASDRFSLRMNAYTYGNPFTGVGGTSHPSTATNAKNDAVSAQLTWTKVVTPQFVNEVKVGYNYFVYVNTAIVNSQEYRLPTITVGGPYNYPKDINMGQESGRDDMFWLKGKHSVKAGGDYINELHHGYFPQYVRGSVTSFSSAPSNLAAVFPVWNDPTTWNLGLLSQTANTFVQGFGSYAYDIRRNTLGFWFQDDWKITNRLTLNLGLRYDNDIGMLNNSLTLASGLLTPHHGDNDNFAPRIGFAWDIFGNRKTVIRGGAGIYYGDIEANQYYDQALFNGVTTIQASIDAKPGAPIVLSQPFGAITGSDFLNHTVAAPLQALQLVDPGVQTPFTLQMSLGFERQLSPNWTVSADYVHFRIYHDWERVDQNLTYDPATGYNLNPNMKGRPDPRFTTILRFETPAAAGALYDGYQMEVRRRFEHGLTLAGSYTLSRIKDSTGGAFYVPNNQFNLGDEWSNGLDDQRHTLNVSGSYQMKWGFVLSGAFHFGSGVDYGITSGSSPFANGGSNRTFLATTRTYDNPSLNYVYAQDPIYMLVKRNGVYGLPIERLDMRVSKTVKLKERARLVGIFECFNVLNHANYGSYNASITTSSFATPAQNLNLEYQPRMLQLAGRFEF
jgi:hypothetical protein